MNRSFRKTMWINSMALLLLALVAGCGGGSDNTGNAAARAELTRNVALWKSSAIPSYRFTLQRDCFCTADATGPVVIEVRNGTRTSITKASGGAVDAGPFASYDTIDKLHTTIQSTLDIPGAKSTIAYDAAKGYPTQANLGSAPNLPDGAQTLHVTNFQVLP